VSRSDEQRIADILAAAAELERVVSKGREAFLRDRIRRRAAERLLEIIGEAANSLGPETTARHGAVAWRGITDFATRCTFPGIELHLFADGDHRLIDRKVRLWELMAEFLRGRGVTEDPED